MQALHTKNNTKILLLEGVHPISVDILKEAGYSNVEWLPKALSEEALIEKIQDVGMIGIRSKTQLTKNVLEQAKNLWAVACFCIGTNQVDLETAAGLGITVFNSPYSNTRSVAELTVALAIMLKRRIAEKDALIHQGLWMKVTEGSHEVRGKTMGIIGYGHIGSQVSVLAESMGFRVLYYDIEPKLPLGNAQSTETLAELLEQSDVVTLHVPADKGTNMLMNRERIAEMKKGAMLINYSRGTVVDIDALYEALREKKTGRCGH